VLVQRSCAVENSCIPNDWSMEHEDEDRVVGVLPGSGMAGKRLAAPVKTEGGLVEGTVTDGLTIYRGIPFGAPPVGDLRWRPPQPVAKWFGIIQADKFAPSCMQGGGAPNAKAKAPAPQGPGRLRGSYPIIYIIGSLAESLLTLSGSERGMPRGSNPPSRNA